MPTGDRITAAKLAGAVSRLSAGTASLDQQIEELDGITRDPVILGMALGDRFAEDHPTLSTAAAIALLRAAGADEEVARRRVEWHEERARHRAEGDGLR